MSTSDMGVFGRIPGATVLAFLVVSVLRRGHAGSGVGHIKRTDDMLTRSLHSRGQHAGS